MKTVAAVRTVKRGRAASALFLGLCLSAGSVPAETLEIQRKVGDFAVNIRFGKNPPVVGKNDVEIEIRDASGAVTTAPGVTVQYYMPPMPRMVPMNYKTEAKPKKGTYRAALNIIMAGPWIVILRITSGEKTLSTKFSIDAR